MLQLSTVSCAIHGSRGRKGRGSPRALSFCRTESSKDTFAECPRESGQGTLQELSFGSLLLTFSSPSPLPYVPWAPSINPWVLPSTLGSLGRLASIALSLSSAPSPRGSLRKRRSVGVTHKLTRVQLLHFPLHIAKFFAFKS